MRENPRDAGETPTEALRYDLRPHPEGGWFRRTWTSPDQLRLVGPDGGERVRPAATLTQFCLPPGECSAWHRVASEEIWIWNGAGRIRLQLGGSGEWPSGGQVLVLGSDATAGEVLQARVPAGVWQCTLASDTTGLASCLVSPGFDFADFTLAETPADGPG